MCEINITRFFAEQVSPRELSASVAEIGWNAGADTWRAACETAGDLQLLTTPGEVAAFREFAQSSGGEFSEDTDWQALFLQWIAGDLREMGVNRAGDAIDWDRADGNIFRGIDGQIYFDVGV